MFFALDADKDGQLSVTELEESMYHVSQVFEKILGRKPNWKALVNSVDSDQNVCG